MIRSTSFLLIVLLVSACGTLNNSQFSKRKHLKGHFWNVKGKYKTQNSKESSDRVYSFSQVEEDKSSVSPKSVLSITVVDEEREIVSDGIVEIVEKEKRNNRATANNELQNEQDLNEEESSENETFETNVGQHLKERPSKAELNFAIFVFILIGLVFWSGIIGLIVTLFLHIFSTIIPWLFYYSLFAVGILLLALVILVIAVAVFDL